ncbi:MAG: transcription termination/antitermination NusG family protein [Candidatus Cloacimonadaceae bacterium]|nr:transcription termination/antitermination NusG family protein [Candidatus Cloacimonadaceae bacterium]MDP3113933.1 transcription termination/antitermination NusG family protein [Candidatus Cloacimonadaceae bacterium]
MATHVPVIIDEIFGELILPSGEERWVVIHTKPRCEKRLADYARKNSIHYYLPQIESKRVYQKRKVSFMKPMFPGYLFIVLDIFKKHTLTISGYCVGFVKVPDQRELLDELQRLYYSRNKKVDMTNTIWLSKGLEVEIVKGPLKGMTGVVENHQKLDEVRLQVNILRQAVMVKINPAHVKILGEYEIIEE